MTTSDYRKAFTQLRAKPVKMKKYIKHNSPKKRSTGVLKRKCERCGRIGAHLSRCKLGFCRQCFREIAQSLGFKKYR
jgi:small subunit ribosomal protein S14